MTTFSRVVICGCGVERKVTTVAQRVHERGKVHQAWVARAQEEAEETVEEEQDSLPPDLQAAVDATEDSPQHRAKMVRGAFAARGWTAESLGPYGTVRDFLKAYGIPITG